MVYYKIYYYTIVESNRLVILCYNYAVLLVYCKSCFVPNLYANRLSWATTVPFSWNVMNLGAYQLSCQILLLFYLTTIIINILLCTVFWCILLNQLLLWETLDHCFTHALSIALSDVNHFLDRQHTSWCKSVPGQPTWDQLSGRLTIPWF